MSGPAGDQAAVREFIARLDRTLAASSAQVELRYGGEDLVPPSHLLPPEDHDPGRVERLVTSAARLAWRHAVPDKWPEMGTIEGPVLGALVLFGLQEALSSQGAWYLGIVGGLAVIATLVASRGLWGLASDRSGWSLLPVATGCVLPVADGASPARLTVYHPSG